MKYFTKEMLLKLQEAEQKVKGTRNYYQYNMECYSIKNGKRLFLGFYVPTKEGTIKEFKGEKFIYCDMGNGEKERFRLTPIVEQTIQ